MTRSAPSLTVIIPTYNWSSVLPFSIGSVLRQTFTDFEVLVIGDGCTDDSAEVVNSVDDARVRWINLPSNSGHQSVPNNEGLRQARGELIAYLGHDDLWLPSHLSCLTEKIASGYDLAYSSTGMIKVQGGPMERVPSQPDYEPGMWVPPICVVHRRKITEELGGWHNYRQLTVDPEAELWERAYNAGYRVTFVKRLTSVKFSASFRRDSYKICPNHEQANWTERIQSERDLEAVELMKMLIAAEEVNRIARQPKLYRDLSQDFLRETLLRIRGRLFKRSAKRRSVQKGDRVESRRRFKGLESRP